MDEKEHSKLTAAENEACTAEEIEAAGQEIEEEIAQESAQKAVLRKIWDAVGYLVVPAVVVFLLLENSYVKKLKNTSLNMPFQLFVTQVKSNLLSLEMTLELSVPQVLLLNLKENNFGYYYH